MGNLIECLATCLVWSWFAALTPGVQEDTVRQLGANTFREREAAEATVREELPAYAPLLRRALGDPDPEVRRRAGLLLEGTKRTPEDSGGHW
jgi:HEAT repeat protein